MDPILKVSPNEKEVISMFLLIFSPSLRVFQIWIYQLILRGTPFLSIMEYMFHIYLENGVS